MEICGIICEFNPFHNGHCYLLKRARELSGCDYLLCIMSGNFTQRGEIALFDKYTRARHAVLGGADCVIELPAAFSVAPAEIFAKGAVKLLSSIPALTSLSFGSESGNTAELVEAAEISDENETFKAELKRNLDGGESYIKSYCNTFGLAGGNPDIIDGKSNNILAIEYIKAFKKTDKPIKFYAVKRQGSDYNDYGLADNFSSASAIRNNLNSEKILTNVPDFVYDDLKNCKNLTEEFQNSLKLILSRTRAEDLTRVYGCSEGLEHALKRLENLPFERIIEEATSRRYTSSRIRRILCENFLNLRRKDCEEYLNSPLYFTPLAVKKSAADIIFSALSQTNLPVITSGSDETLLTNRAKDCKNSDNFAQGQWCQIAGKTINGKLVTV